jgi:hypothetical protein
MSTELRIYRCAVQLRSPLPSIYHISPMRTVPAAYTDATIISSSLLYVVSTILTSCPLVRVDCENSFDSCRESDGRRLFSNAVSNAHVRTD